MQALAQAQFLFETPDSRNVGNMHIEAILAHTAGGGEALRASRWQEVPQEVRIAAAGLAGLALAAGAGELIDLSPQERHQLHVHAQTLIEQLQQLVRATKVPPVASLHH
ncbi:MAG: hypothetical protein GAK35_04110 [Herbaspirillum frisingense]|uniref:Uncharacterized protein n=1 Tax=Herbaspirillum frisingense TaxID=92645 RepID=A0A7V8FTC6_9BURK|nr:MAG: hypothetical protein GAK35_04110 [Herbaspirillum frisingense]